MVFSNAVFLFVFLPIVLAGYYILRGFARNYWLLFVSLVFYAWNKPEFLLILLGSIVLNYASAILVDRAGRASVRKLCCGLAVALNLLLLYYFKYLNFTVDVVNRLFRSDIQLAEIVLPIGISFFTFQGLSYVVDVYRNDVPVQKNICRLGMYISLFPQLVAGPIVRYKDVVSEIDSRRVTLDDFAYGVQRFIIGLFKKAVLADTMAVAADSIFGMDPILNSVDVAWLGVFAYTLQIFFDFSGYSDMAIGMGRMFGFHFLENFNYPYISKSITEFWRRWHISLSSFFRDYVYIPLGGNRRHVYLNVAIVFLLTGIWHGAAETYILWGIWNGIFNIGEKALLNRNKKKGETASHEGRIAALLKHIYTMAVVMIGWVIFRAEDCSHMINYLLSMVGLRNNAVPAFTIRWYLDNWTLTIFVISIFLSTPVFGNICRFLSRRLNANLWLALKYLALLLILLLCVLRIASNTYSSFIYFQF